MARVELLGHRRAGKCEVGETQETGLERHFREERPDYRLNLERHGATLRWSWRGMGGWDKVNLN